MAKRSLTTALLLAALAAVALAGERIDALRTGIGDARAALTEGFPTNPKAQKAATKADLLFAEADDLLSTVSPTSGKKGLKKLGQALRQVKKAAKKEGNVDFDALRDQIESDLWELSSAVFVPDDVIVPGDPEQEALLNRLAKKLAKPLKLAAKGRLGKAVGKLGKAWPTLLELDSDP